MVWLIETRIKPIIRNERSLRVSSDLNFQNTLQKERISMLSELYDIFVVSPEWPKPVKINMLISFFFLSVAFLLFLFIVINRIRDRIKVAQQRWIERKALNFITTYLFMEKPVRKSAFKNFRRKYFLNDLLRKAFLDTLLKLHKNIIGESSEKTRALYRELKLNKYSERRLKSSSWSTVAGAICEISELGIKADLELIRPFVNHPNFFLRSEAIVAMLRLENRADLSFLNDLKQPLSEWQQIQLINAVQKVRLNNLPDLEKWLQKGTEESILIFCIRIVAEYGQYNLSDQLLRLLTHPFPSAQVRKEVYRAIRHMEIYNAAQKLKQLYNYEPADLKREILKTLDVIGLEFKLRLQEATSNEKGTPPLISAMAS